MRKLLPASCALALVLLASSARADVAPCCCACGGAARAHTLADPECVGHSAGDACNVYGAPGVCQPSGQYLICADQSGRISERAAEAPARSALAPWVLALAVPLLLRRRRTNK